MLMRARTGRVAAAVAILLAALLLGSCAEPTQDQNSDAPRSTAPASEQATDPSQTPVQDEGRGASSIAESVETAAALPRLIDLGADKCVPCKMMAPILEELRETYAGEFDVVFIDVWKDRTAGQQYGVRVIPTQIFFAPDGSELFRHQGFFSREEILATWSEFGYDFDGPTEEE